MMRLIFLLWALAGATLMLSGSLAASMVIHEDIPFAETPEKPLLLDLYLPGEGKVDGLIIWIHGGGWTGGSRKPCPVTWLTEYQYAVASVSYRFTQEATFPAQIHDIKAAVRWLRAHADQYGYPADRIAAAGSSAGGYLAALLGTSHKVAPLEGELGGHTDQSSEIAVVINYYGASDFILRSKTQPQRTEQVGSVVYKLLGGPASVLTDQAVMASPAFHVDPTDAPMLILHGVQDETVLIDQGMRLFTRYLEAGLPVEFYAIDGFGHGGNGFFEGTRRQMVVDFLAKYLAPAPAGDSPVGGEP